MDLKTTVKETDLFLFDMDGTIYRGGKIFDFTAELLSEIKKKGKKYIFLTNNSSMCTDGFAEKLKRLGITAETSEIVTAGYATVLYIKENFPTAKVYLCGTKSFKAEMAENKITVTDDIKIADTVVVTSDTELTYKKLWDASYLLTVKNARFIGANCDDVVPTEFGAVPDCGSFCDMLYNSTKRRPVYIGKPEAKMAEIALKRMGCDRQNALLVGDRFDTDISCGINAKVKTALVLSGDTTTEMAEKSKLQPDMILPSAKEILKVLKDM